jgi:hypothetical protein
VHPKGLEETLAGLIENFAINSIYRTAEEFNVVLEVYANSINEFDEFLKLLYRENEFIIDTHSIIVLNDQIKPVPFIFPLL